MNSKLLEANDVKPYFRVNSVFFDPNIYGRYLALTMTGLAYALLWTRRPREGAWIAVALAVLWGGLPCCRCRSRASRRCSSGLRCWPRCAGGRSRCSRRSPRRRSRRRSSWRSPADAVGGQDRVGGVVRPLDQRAREPGDGRGRHDRRPAAVGLRVGSFRERYREREGVRSQRIAAISHTTPLTIGAEQGAIGLIAYGFLLWAAFTVLFSRLRGAVHREAPGIPAVARAALAAAFCGLIAHTLVYAAFLEDPLVWTLPPSRRRSRSRPASRRPPRRARGAAPSSPPPRPERPAPPVPWPACFPAAAVRARPARGAGRCSSPRWRRSSSTAAPSWTLATSRTPRWSSTRPSSGRASRSPPTARSGRSTASPRTTGASTARRGGCRSAGRGRRSGAIARRLLLEFPPVIYRGSIYQLADNGVLIALRKNTGRKRWRRDLGHLSASSPHDRRREPVRDALLERRRGLRAGRVVSLWLKWRAAEVVARPGSSRSESSPLLHRGRIYLGSEDGTLYCLNAHNGRTVRRYRADGAISGQPDARRRQALLRRLRRPRPRRAAVERGRKV